MKLDNQESVQPQSIAHKHQIHEASILSKHFYLPRVILILLVALLAASISGYIFFMLGKASTQSVNLTKQAKIASYEESSIWKTYVNRQYGFQLTYPAKGIVFEKDPSAKFGIAYAIGSCGSGIQLIHDTSTSHAEDIITIDNFFEIKISSINGTLWDYINQNDPNVHNTYTPIIGTNADEAYSVHVPKNANSIPIGGEPLSSVIALYRKSNKLFMLGHDQNASGLGGCVDADGPPSNATTEIFSGLTKEEYANVYNTYYRDWNIPQRVKFTQ